MNNLSSIANRVLDQCESTNDLAKSLAENGYPHGTWVSTRVQTSGRGRLGRKWESIDGNLFLSILVRVENQALWSWVPLASGVAVVRCLHRMFPKLSVQVKWPNDLWLENGKLGGVLCEGAGGREKSYIVIGIGLNCVRSPEGLDQLASDLTSARGGETITADQIRPFVIAAVLEEIDYLVSSGPEKIFRAYDMWSLLPPGSTVEWGQPPQSGTVKGLGPAGELEVIRSDGMLTKLYADDVRSKLHSDKRR